MIDSHCAQISLYKPSYLDSPLHSLIHTVLAHGTTTPVLRLAQPAIACHQSGFASFAVGVLLQNSIDIKLVKLNIARSVGCGRSHGNLPWLSTGGKPDWDEGWWMWKQSIVVTKVGRRQSTEALLGRNKATRRGTPHLDL